jgi:hypothetical protein
MKKTIMLLTAIGLLIANPFHTKAQYTSPSDPGGAPIGKPPLGGSAPVGGGLFILLGLGAAYGGKKLYHLFDDEKNNENENLSN